MDNDYPADTHQLAAQSKAAFLASGQVGRPPGSYGASAPSLAKDMPLTAQLSDTFSHQIQIAESALKTLAEAHQRVFGPLPPSAEGAGGALAPQPDTVESHLIGAQRGLSERLYALQHIAGCIANRL